MGKNQIKINELFRVCRCIAFVLGVILLSTWTLKSAPLESLTQYKFQQDAFKEITGIVKTQDGDPIPGAVVLKVGTNQGTDTDIDGRYSLNVNEGDKIQFVFEGFKTTTVTVGKSNILNVTMIEDGIDLSDIVVDKYKTVSKEQMPPHGTLAFTNKTIEGEPKAKTVTTTPRIECGYPSRWYREMLALNANSQHLNISTQVKTKTVTTTPIIKSVNTPLSFEHLLQGQMISLDFLKRYNPSERNPEVILRDVENLTRNGNYTYIVDGVSVSEETFRSLNQNDVESVDIYKHTDVYNARFGNKENQSRITLEAR